MDLAATTSLLQALADPSRLRLLSALASPPGPGGDELCACQLVELLDLAHSTVSKHLFLLRSAGLVESRKQGRWMYYRLPEQPTEAVAGALAWILPILAGDAAIARDARLLGSILQITPEDLCCRQRPRGTGGTTETHAACCGPVPTPRPSTKGTIHGKV